MSRTIYLFWLQLIIFFSITWANSEVSLPVHRIENKPYIFSNDLEKLPEISIKNVAGDRLELTLYTSKITFYVGGSFVEVNKKLYQMPLWVIQHKNGFYLPYHGFSRIMEELDLFKASLNPADDITTIEFIQFNITGVKFVGKSNGSVIRIITNTDFNLNEISYANNFLAQLLYPIFDVFSDSGVEIFFYFTLILIISNTLFFKIYFRYSK